MRFPALVDLTCQQVTELASEFMTASSLRMVERARFEQHLYACTWCMTYMQQLAQTVQATRRLADEPTLPDPAGVLALFRGAAQPGAAQPGAAQPGTDSPTETFALPSPGPLPTPASAAIPRSRFALKFLQRGAVGAVSGFAWPKPEGSQPGPWVQTAAPLAPCERGVHACGTADLAHWLHDELWLVELAGESAASIAGVVAARGRLVREVVEWRGAGALRFAQAAYDHAHAQVHEPPGAPADALRCLASAARHLPRGNVALTAYCAAMAVARRAGGARFDQDAYDAERRHQSALIQRDLALDRLLSEAGGATSDAP